MKDRVRESYKDNTRKSKQKKKLLNKFKSYETYVKDKNN